LFAAALLIVANSVFYRLTEDAMALVVSAECVLACWGHSKTVRRMCDRNIKDIVDAALVWATSHQNVMWHVIERQPFMTAGWRPDENENTPLGRAVETLLHRWENKPWASAKTFVGICERHCIETGKYAQNSSYFFPAVPETDSLLDIAELGATIADVVSPNSGSTTHGYSYKRPLRHGQ